MAGRIRIRLKAFDHAVIDQASRRHRSHGGEDGRAGVGTDSAADEDAALDRAALAARRQEVARAVRAEDAQARDRHPRLACADGGRADEAGSAGGRGRRDQGRVTTHDRNHRQEAGHDPDLQRDRGSRFPCTVVEAPPNPVVFVNEKERTGYRLRCSSGTASSASRRESKTGERTPRGRRAIEGRGRSRGEGGARRARRAVLRSFRLDDAPGKNPESPDVQRRRRRSRSTSSRPARR